MKTNPNDPINVMYEEPNVNEHNGGLTKREYFAVMILQGLVSDPVLSTNKTPLETAHIAMVYVDALIQELNKD